MNRWLAVASCAILAWGSLTPHAAGSGQQCEVSVVWEQIDSPLDGNPGPPHTVLQQGLRIYPGRPTATDTTPYQIVHVVATITPAYSGVPVYFKLLDVSDPSSATYPVDLDVPMSEGDDNRTT